MRDILADRVNAAKQGIAEALARRIGDPPRTVAARKQKDDEYRAFWRPADGWEDPQVAEQKAQQMYQQGAKPQDVLKAMYPLRVELLVLEDRRDNLEAQVRFTNEMVAERAKRGTALLEESMKVLDKEAPGGD